MTQTTKAGPGTTTLPLQDPIKAYGDEITSIELRRPKAKDIRKLGFPFESTGEAQTASAEKVARYVERLGNVPPQTVDEMTPVDMINAMEIVAGFFDPSPSTSSTSSGTLPATSDSSPANSGE